MDNYFDTLTWKGNSRAMVNAVIHGTPALFRNMLKNMLIDWSKAQNLTVIDEETVFRAVNELAPKNMAQSKILPELNKLKTK